MSHTEDSQGQKVLRIMAGYVDKQSPNPWTVSSARCVPQLGVLAQPSLRTGSRRSVCSISKSSTEV